jgi:hypothetical protein
VGEGSASRPGRSLPPGKTPYPLYRKLGGPEGRFGQMRKIQPPPRFDPGTVQPVASCCTDYATRPTHVILPLMYYLQVCLQALNLRSESKTFYVRSSELQRMVFTIPIHQNYTSFYTIEIDKSLYRHEVLDSAASL